MCPFFPGADICWAYIRLCIPGTEAQRPPFYFSTRPYFLLALARLPRFSHLVENRQKWFLRVLSTKIPSWSSLMPFILWEALQFVSKELRAFRESSVKRKWRKYAIAGIMFVLLLFPNNVPPKNNWHCYHEPSWSSGQLTLLSVWPSCISCHRNQAKSPLPQVDISCP